MGSLVQVLGIERGAETKGDTGAEQNIVGKSSNTTVVDLDLYRSEEMNQNFTNFTKARKVHGVVGAETVRYDEP